MREIPVTPEQAKQAIIRLIQTFCPEKSDTRIIIGNKANNLTFNELVNLLESSIRIQQGELETLRKASKRLSKQVDRLAQGELL